MIILTHQLSHHERVRKLDCIVANRFSRCSTYTTLQSLISDDNQSVIQNLLTAPRFIHFAL